MVRSEPQHRFADRVLVCANITQLPILKEAGWKQSDILTKPVKTEYLYKQLSGQIHFELNENDDSEHGKSSYIEKKASEHGSFSPMKPVKMASPANGRLKYVPQILIADDSETQRKSLLHLCEQYGCNCELVSNGKQAIEAYSHRRFDMIFMDLHMPVCDGYDATQKIRGLEVQYGWSQTSIVGLTASVPLHNNFPEHQEYTKCRGLGMDYLGTNPNPNPNPNPNWRSWYGLSRNQAAHDLTP